MNTAIFVLLAGIVALNRGKCITKQIKFIFEMIIYQTLFVIVSISILLFSKASDIKDNPLFTINAPKDANNPPWIQVTFSNGVQDELDLISYENLNHPLNSCVYHGRLRNHPSSSVAVTGCLDKDDGKMEITLISDHSIHKMFLVDRAGNVDPIRSPFERGGIC